MTGSLDADTTRRVLRRANELAQGDDHRLDRFEPEAIISAALEVGIPERATRQSLAIERLGDPPSVHLGDGLFGAATLWDERVIEVPADRVLELLDRWLVIGHHLRRQGASGDEVVWSHRDDLVAGVRRRLSGLVGEGRLARARCVRARVHPIDQDSTVVRIVVDRRLHRRLAVIGGWTLGAGGVSLVVAGALVAAPLLLLAVPIAAVGGALIWASRRQANRFRRELERLLGAIAESRPPGRVGTGVRRRLALAASHWATGSSPPRHHHRFVATASSPSVVAPGASPPRHHRGVVAGNDRPTVTGRGGVAVGVGAVRL